MNLFYGLTGQDVTTCVTLICIAFSWFVCIIAVIVGAVIGLYFCLRFNKRNKLDMVYIRLKSRAWFRAFRQYKRDMRDISKMKVKEDSLKKLGVDLTGNSQNDGK